MSLGKGKQISKIILNPKLQVAYRADVQVIPHISPLCYILRKRGIIPLHGFFELSLGALFSRQESQAGEGGMGEREIGRGSEPCESLVKNNFGI